MTDQTPVLTCVFDTTFFLTLGGVDGYCWRG